MGFTAARLSAVIPLEAATPNLGLPGRWLSVTVAATRVQVAIGTLRFQRLRHNKDGVVAPSISSIRRRTAVPSNNFGDEGKSKAGTLDCLNSWRPTESVKDAIQNVLQNAEAAIVHHDAVPFDGDFYRGIGRAELGGIGQHICHRSFQMGRLPLAGWFSPR